MKKMKSDAHLNSVNWKLVAKNLVQVADLHSEYKLKHPLIAAWQEALNIERMSYAEQVTPRWGPTLWVTPRWGPTLWVTPY